MALDPGPGDDGHGPSPYITQRIPGCAPRVFTVGQGFIEEETVHILRNEGNAGRAVDVSEHSAD